MDVIKKPFKGSVRFKLCFEYDLIRLPFNMSTDQGLGTQNKTTFYHFLPLKKWNSIKEDNPSKTETLRYFSDHISHTNVIESFCKDEGLEVDDFYTFAPFFEVEFQCVS